MRTNLLVGVAVAALMSEAAFLQQGTCTPEWLPGFHVPGTSSSVDELLTFDDQSGSGPTLYIAGSFITAGSASAPTGVARWDGTTWTGMGNNPTISVQCMAIFDDGSGPTLYVGGGAQTPDKRVQKWTAQGWVSVAGGASDTVMAMTVYNDGTGDALYIGGFFTVVGGGTPASRVAKWDGKVWSQLGAGCDGPVRALQVFTSGGQSTLMAGGEFNFAGGVQTPRLAAWDGSSWSYMGGITGARVNCLEFVANSPDGGPMLYAGGSFSNVEGVSAASIARWNGSFWSAMGSGVQPVGEVHDLAFADFENPSIYATGSFTVVGGTSVSRLARWDGVNWHDVGSGMNGLGLALTVFDDGGVAGPGLIVGGSFTVAGTGTQTGNLARWNGESWSTVGGGSAVDAEIRDMAIYHDQLGGGPALYATGRFTRAGSTLTSCIARWSGQDWTPLGTGLQIEGLPLTGGGNALAVFDSGSGTELYVAGLFTAAGGISANSIAKWNGATWSAIPGTVGGTIYDLTVFDDGSGPALYAAGSFSNLSGVSNIARWNGTTWSALGAGVNSPALALTVHDDGVGDALYVGGLFSLAGGAPALGVAKWDGRNWSALGSGVSGAVNALAWWDDGGGPELYATVAVSGATSIVTKWDGTAWTSLGTDLTGGASPEGNDLTVFDDGSGSALYVGGKFTHVGNLPASTIARWNGSSFSAVGNGMSSCPTCAPRTRSLLVVPSGGAVPEGLYAGGSFQLAGSTPSGSLARWGCAAALVPCLGDAFADQQVNINDLLVVINQWGPCPGECPPLCSGDVTTDCAVNINDLLMVINHWGACPQ